MEKLNQVLKQNGEVHVEELDAALEEQPARACPVERSVQLDNKELWKEFHEHTNEMIITKAGRRMFPLIQLSFENLDPQATYHLLLALRVVNNRRWRFLNGEWTGSEPVMRGVASETTPTSSCIYLHHLSPSVGKEWMKLSPVSFSKLKLSNKESVGGKVKLSSLHRYQPVVYLVKSTPQQDLATGADAQATMASSTLEISEYLFEETQFVAVTAYQNEAITQIKIKHNPFAKAFLPNHDKPPAGLPPLEPHSSGHPLSAGSESEAHFWPAGSGLPQSAGPIPHYYYSDARYVYPPSYLDYYDTFAPVPYHS